MTDTKNKGGAAFPREDYQTDDAPGQKGMTLRDWFAGQWVAAGHHANITPRDAAEQAYEFADAMLEARDQ